MEYSWFGNYQETCLYQVCMGFVWILHSRSEWVVGSGSKNNFASGRPAGRPSVNAIANMRFWTVRFWQPRPLFSFFGKHFNDAHPFNSNWMFLPLGHGARAFLGCSLASVPTRGSYSFDPSYKICSRRNAAFPISFDSPSRIFFRGVHLLRVCWDGEVDGTTQYE